MHWREGLGIAPAEAHVGALPGDGAGPELVDAALTVLRRMQEVGGDPIAVEVVDAGGVRDVLARGGCVLRGPLDGGSPVPVALTAFPAQARTALLDVSPLRADLLDGLDLVLLCGDDEERLLAAAVRLAARRRGSLALVAAADRPDAVRAAAEQGVTCERIAPDLAAYRLLASPRDFDVVAAPVGDGETLQGLAGALAGTRSLTFAVDVTAGGQALYRPGHGTARAVAGRDRANPAGALLALAMLLRTSLGREREAAAIEAALRRLWREGHRTLDVATRSSRLIGTREMTELVAESAAALYAARLRD